MLSIVRYLISLFQTSGYHLPMSTVISDIREIITPHPRRYEYGNANGLLVFCAGFVVVALLLVLLMVPVPVLQASWDTLIKALTGM